MWQVWIRIWRKPCCRFKYSCRRDLELAQRTNAYINFRLSFRQLHRCTLVPRKRPGELNVNIGFIFQTKNQVLIFESRQTYRVIRWYVITYLVFLFFPICTISQFMYNIILSVYKQVQREHLLLALVQWPDDITLNESQHNSVNLSDWVSYEMNKITLFSLNFVDSNLCLLIIRSSKLNSNRYVINT